MKVKEQVKRMLDALITKCIKYPIVFWIIFISMCLIGSLVTEIFATILEMLHPVVQILLVIALVAYGIFGPPLLKQDGDTSDKAE